MTQAESAAPLRMKKPAGPELNFPKGLALCLLCDS